MASTRQSWQCSDSGILRKREENEEELLVFGYSCKLFRDDDKARYIDQGKHLIPWMGDESLKIDRYDGRGALYDLKQYEPLPGGHDENFWRGMSETERHVEQLCDEERYRALHHNEEEEALYQEEELKRLHQALGNNAYGQVAFDYDETNGKPDEKGDGNAEEMEEAEEDVAFVPPPELDLPVGMVVPETVKLNAIIEKTAVFISKQGPQMEIIIKMKQANNPQFQFLSFDSPLHSYYRHMLNAIKAGRYQPQSSSKPQEEAQDDAGDDHYLHPSLAATGSRVELAPSIPSINYKPSTDCAYSMLVNRIKDKQAAFGLIAPLSQPEEPVMPAVEAGMPGAIMHPHMVAAASSGVMHHYYMNEPVISAAPVRYNLPPEKMEPEPEPVALCLSPGIPSVPCAPLPATLSATTVMPLGKGVITKDKTIKNNENLPHASNADLAGSNSPELSSNIVTPPPDMQIIIDKMASYVAKNGQDFETIVRSKGDNRFAFLDHSHPHNPYYRHKISVYAPQIESETRDEQHEVEMDKQEEGLEADQDTDAIGEESQDGVLHSPEDRDDDDDDDEGSRKGKPAPVSFSIKKPKETEHGLLEKRSALPVEESSDEEGQEGDKNKTEGKVEKPPPATAEIVKEPVSVPPAKEEAEIIDLTDDSNNAPPPEKRSGGNDRARWAEERLKDKLASAAREKLAAAAREKQLQAERKRRAAAFLNMIGREHPLAKCQLPSVIGPQLPDGAPLQPIPELTKHDVDSDVSSIPSPISFPPTPPSPPQISRKDEQERLSPKHNGENKCSSSLYSRIQASNPSLRKLKDGSRSSSPGGEAPGKSNSNGKSSRHKRKHHDHSSVSPASQKVGEESHHRHKRLKKKSHSRSRSHSRSHGSQPSHSHHQSFRSSASSDWDPQKGHKKKKKKKKSHHRSSSESSSK